MIESRDKNDRTRSVPRTLQLLLPFRPELGAGRRTVKYNVVDE